MTEAAASSSGGRPIKQESEAFGFFDSLDILATIATQELKSKSEEKEQTPDSEDDPDSDGRSGGRGGSTQPKKLAEMEIVNMEQIRSMSANTLLRIFTETDFDEMKRMYCYTCMLLPGECEAKFQSFGNENKAKKEMRQHLEEHVDQLVKEGNNDFIAEPILARKRRMKEIPPGLVVKPPAIRKKIKAEPFIEPETYVEKENTEITNAKKRKEDFVPMLSEISNDQESKRYKIKKETTDIPQENVEIVTVEVKQEYTKEMRQSGGQSVRSGPGERSAIDEDHCYAFKAGRVKAEFWPEYDNNAATAFTSIQENDETYDTIKESSDLASVEVIQSCPVVLEEEYQFQEDTMYQQEFIVETSETVVTEGVEVETEPLETEETFEPPQPVLQQQPQPQQQVHEDVGVGEFTAIVYQDTEQFYTETIVTDSGMALPVEVETTEIRQVPVRIKNKRTVAAVSNEDKRLALNAMEELRSRGATTDDLMCRLCDPPRPFTAYSTLLTHYRSHAGLRPFECSLCGATFTRQHSLNYHLMTHANQTRFTCPHCNRKFRHPTHYKEHVKKHGEVVQFVCQFCSASLSTQSQYRKHLKMRHDKTIDIMGNVIDSQTDVKERDKTRRKRKMTTEDQDPSTGLPSNKMTTQNTKRKRRKKGDMNQVTEVKAEASSELGSYEEVVAGLEAGDVATDSGTVLYEETVPIAESEQMYQNSELLETQNGFEIVCNNSDVPSFLNPDPFVPQPSLQQEVTTTISPAPKFSTTQIIHSSTAPLSIPTLPTSVQPGSHVTGNLVAHVSHVTSISSGGSQPSPVIFVVPNNGQTGRNQTQPEVIRKPLIVNDQKKPIVVSSFQTNSPANNVTKLNQGVIAQINGQKVLLVPKKKENIQTTVKNVVQKIQQPVAVKLATSYPQIVAANPKVVTVKTHLAAAEENQENDAENNKVNGTEKSTILEQAMFEVFPSSLEIDEKKDTVTNNTIENVKEGELYHPMRSPLMNRKKILCEVLGIDS